MPDFGAAEFVPRWGATVTGVRKFLIAYNINMIATKEQAHKWVAGCLWSMSGKGSSFLSSFSMIELISLHSNAHTR